MSIDLLPFNAFALESAGPPARLHGEGKTLTVKPALTALQSDDQAMSGKASANQSFMFSIEPLRVAVVPADGRPITITFADAAAASPGRKAQKRSPAAR